MTRSLFITMLKKRLVGLPKEDAGRWCAFYDEAIADRVEEGLTEEEAIAALGTQDEIAEQILAETPLSRIVKEKIKPKRRMSVGMILLLSLGSPLWISLLVAAAAVFIAVYAVMWSLVAVIYACDLSFAVSAPAGLIYAGYYTFSGQPGVGIALFGAAIILSGLTAVCFVGGNASARGMIKLTKRFPLWIKKLFVRGGNE